MQLFTLPQASVITIDFVPEDTNGGPASIDMTTPVTYALPSSGAPFVATVQGDNGLKVTFESTSTALPGNYTVVASFKDVADGPILTCAFIIQVPLPGATQLFGTVESN